MQAHVVSAFEQSLSNMTQRFHQLSATAERKDGELTDLRQTIELLRKQSIQAGLTSAHMQSMGVQAKHQHGSPMGTLQRPELGGVHSEHGSPMHLQPNNGQNTNNNVIKNDLMGGTQQPGRHLSSDSMCSLNSISSGCSTQDGKKKKKGWVSVELHRQMIFQLQIT